ncbi:porin family protein [Sphingomonas lacunae]|uniref:Porin family protein n=1 Tax=Sphingomonas lacunae TaxID=2698828 RepID=A0A6M4AVM3_9SPHN|nr:outer membrane beta-barrel protein [Sphingomonas lacunae]QJQ33188.1 porin family protein [Sphingomonas lacunae]
MKQLLVSGILLTAAAMIGAAPAEAHGLTGPADPRPASWAAIMAGYDASELPDKDGPETMAAIAIGHDWQRPGWFFGVEAELGSSHADKTMRDYAAPGDVIRVAYGLDISGGLRVGLPVITNLSAYAKGGYANTRLSVSYQGSGTDLHSFTRPGALDGFYTGAGVELTLSRRWLLRGEYRYANFHDGLYRHQGVLAVGLRF